jgi:urate oxidase
MVVKLEVFKTVHNTWPAKNGMAAGESFDLLCLDVSHPTEHRMEEMLFYRTKPEERETHYVNGTGKTITVGVAKIRHADISGSQFCKFVLAEITTLEPAGPISVN